MLIQINGELKLFLILVSYKEVSSFSLHTSNFEGSLLPSNFLSSPFVFKSFVFYSLDNYFLARWLKWASRESFKVVTRCYSVIFNRLYTTMLEKGGAGDQQPHFFYFIITLFTIMFLSIILYNSSNIFNFILYFFLTSASYSRSINERGRGLWASARTNRRGGAMRFFFFFF